MPILNKSKSQNSVLNSRQSVFLLKRNWITEKSTALANFGKYVFLVDKKANKPETAKLIEEIYGVKVKDINIINIKSKIKRLGRSIGRVPGFKKAIVTLKEGDKIDVMPV